MINVDIPKVGEITDEMVEKSYQASSRFGGNARISSGRVWTNEAYEERRKRVLNTPLP